MPLYRLIYRYRDTTEELTMEIEAERACYARDDGRNNMNARRLDPIDWPCVSQTLVVEST